MGKLPRVHNSAEAEVRLPRYLGRYRTLELEEHPCVELRVIIPQRLDALAVTEVRHLL